MLGSYAQCVVGRMKLAVAGRGGKGRGGSQGALAHPMPCSSPPGLHSVEVSYEGSPVPNSPFQVPVTEGCDPARVRVHGPGLQSGTTNQPNKFTVETR